jgi:Zn-dependent peptidase ImmA (M78 family)/DNA-binding XRE family transcriptional regulator
MTTNLIGPRLKALRETHGLDQEKVAAILGVGSRQIVSQIETGERRVSGEELMRLIDGLGADLDYFTDPFRLEGEGAFSWRQSHCGAATLAAYQTRAGAWLAAYRYLAEQTNKPSSFRRSLRLDRGSSFDQAAAEGERIAIEFDLGDIPALRLGEVMEQAFDILVLMVDAPAGISGAACRLTELDAVLVNRLEVPGRRYFDLAHELFHLLTWDAMPPDPIEAIDAKGHVEKLANAFASALLMPRSVIQGDWRKAGSVPALAAMINERADTLQVTAQALKWRLVTAKLLSRQRATAIPDEMLRHNGRSAVAVNTQPPLYSHRFMEVLGRGIDHGFVSRRRAARLLELSPNGRDLAELFEAHGRPVPEGL